MEEQTKKEQQLDYEKLKQVAITAQQKAAMLENKLNAINFTAMRLDYLFKILGLKGVVSDEFYNKCVREIEETLDIKEETNEEGK